MHVNIGHWIRKNAQLFATKDALIVANRSVTYAQMNDRVNRLTNKLHSLGLEKGDRIGALLLNSIEYLELLFACAKKGYVLVPLNFRLSAPELEFILNDCTPKALFFDPFFASLVAPLKESVSSLGHFVETPILGGGEYDSAFIDDSSPAEALDESVGGDDNVLIMYTAGTTGRAKGVVLTHDNCFAQSVNGWALGIAPNIVSLVVLPLFHVGGLNGSVTPMLHVGATTVLVPKFDPAEVLALVEKHNVNGIMGVPTVHQMLMEHPNFETTNLNSLSVLISGGAALPEFLYKEFNRRGYEMRQGYGLTECSPGVTGMGPGDFLARPGSVGKPCLYTEVRIADDSGIEVPTGQVGEIQVKGPNVMKGYWNLPEETDASFVDGWFKTGDLGRMDEDAFLFISGRKKEMLISGGENVYPAEIENVLTSHPDVSMAAVVGQPHEKWGEVPVAFVMPMPGKELSADELTMMVAERLARYKVPHAIHVRPLLPLSAAGKILKRQLEEEINQEAN